MNAWGTRHLTIGSGLYYLCFKVVEIFSVHWVGRGWDIIKNTFSVLTRTYFESHLMRITMGHEAPHPGLY